MSDQGHAAERPREAEEVRKARLILREQTVDPREMKRLAADLRNVGHFGLSRRLLARALETGIDDEKLRNDVRQKLALSTYKDPDLPAEQRLDDALSILAKGWNLSTTTDQETLGLTGAIYKRRWELDSQKANLERSLAYYMRGYEIGVESDQGYTAINAAYVLDVLAKLEVEEAEAAGVTSDIAAARIAKAREIREDVVTRLPPLLEREDTRWLAGEWWFYATMIEAFFGLERFDEARAWVAKGLAACPKVPWEHHSTATQLASLDYVLRPTLRTAEAFEASPAGRVLADLMEGRVAGVRTAFVGKVGLALSGGGFRASLFHIGVLARLAELDVLRHVEVLSCVSGGSIVGAHYYLELKKLLEEKRDELVERQDYVDLVKRMEKDFLEGVQENIRMRVAAELTTNLKMMFLPGFSRTRRAGELYERHLYARVRDGRGDAPRWMSDLRVTPAGEPEGFAPKHDNWRRRAKVPELILNATTLNTGHNWQFTATWMGEPPGGIDAEVDANHRLRRMYYGDAPDAHERIRLGHAVGASACVPGIFEPLPLRGLYPERTVRLVDGGVHDNQGIVGLLGADCSVALVSDASGQMGSLAEPGDGIVPVLLRSNAIAGSRIRAEQFDELKARKRAGTLRSLMVTHLMQDLDEDPVDWEGCQDPYDASDEARPPYRRGHLTRYGVRKDVQRHLARIRTDLDSFSDAEAFALMASGYHMTEHAFDQEASLKRLPTHEVLPEERSSWRFMVVERAITDGSEPRWLLERLRVSSKRAFKVWHLVPALRALAVVLAVLGVAAAVWLAQRYWSSTVLEGRHIAVAVMVLAVGAVFGKWAARAVRVRSTLWKMAVGAGLAATGWLVVRLHLLVFDKLFLRVGRVPKEPA